MRRRLVAVVLGAVLALGAVASTATGHVAKELCAGPWEDAPAIESPETDKNANGNICVQGKGQYKDDHDHLKK